MADLCAGIIDITAKKAPRGAFGYNIYVVIVYVIDNIFVYF